MDRAKRNANCWPTEQQKLLLRAALLKGKDSIEAWERWKSSVDIEHLDIGSHRLLPHLYRNLQDQGVKDPQMSKFKDVYRKTWRDNELLFHHVSSLLLAFRDGGIETIVPKGAAVTLLHAASKNSPPMAETINAGRMAARFSPGWSGANTHTKDSTIQENQFATKISQYESPDPSPEF